MQFGELVLLVIAGIERKVWKNGMEALFKEDSIILYLLSRKANVNSRDNYGSTPLHYAASKSNETAVIQLLTDKNIDLEVCMGIMFMSKSSYLNSSRS